MDRLTTDLILIAVEEGCKCIMAHKIKGELGVYPITIPQVQNSRIPAQYPSLHHVRPFFSDTELLVFKLTDGVLLA
jgi:hypothetical protein